MPHGATGDLVNHGASPIPTRVTAPQKNLNTPSNAALVPTAQGLAGGRAVPINEDEANPTHRLMPPLAPGTPTQAAAVAFKSSESPTISHASDSTPAGAGSHPLGTSTQPAPGRVNAAQAILDRAAAATSGETAAAPVADAGTLTDSKATTSPTDNVYGLGENLLNTFKMQYATLWNNVFSAEHQDLLTDILNDVAYVSTAQMAGQDTQAMRGQISAQLANIAGVEHAQLVHAVWATLGQVAKTSLDFAIQAALTAVPAPK